jgi:hypothetical protein
VAQLDTSINLNLCRILKAPMAGGGEADAR